MTKFTFLVKYSGSNKKLQGFLEQVTAKCKRHAVETIYAKFFDANYFCDDYSILWGGIIRDCDGNIIANADDDTISCDGGFLYAEEMVYFEKIS